MAVGLGNAVHPVYILHIVPEKYKGAAGSISGLSGTVAFFVASFLGINSILGNDQLYMFIFIFEEILALAHTILNVSFLHECPLFLMRNGREEEAKQCIQYHFGSKDSNFKLEELRAQLKIQNRTSIWDVFRDSTSVRALSLSVAVNLSVAFSGIVPVSFFGTFHFKQIGFSENHAAIANCLSVLAAIAGSIVALLLFDTLGRRLLIIGSLVSLSLINLSMMLLIGLFDSTRENLISWLFLGLFIMFLFVFK